MSSDLSHAELEDLLRRVEAKEPGAAEEFCRAYRDIVEEVVGGKRLGGKVGRVVGVSDLCQSGVVAVLGHLEQVLSAECIPDYLRAMARNRRWGKYRYWSADKRDVGRADEDQQQIDRLCRDAKTASELAATAEEYELLLKDLPAPARAVIEGRMSGLSWQEAGALGGHNAESARKLVGRAIQELRERHAPPGGTC